MTTLEATNITVALGTLILAFFTWRAARASQAAAEATREAARAARDEADATATLAAQAEQDRELVWRPHLVVECRRVTSYPTKTIGVELTVRNVGRGAALGAVVWGYEGHGGASYWGKSPAMAIAAGASTETMELQLDPPGQCSFPEGLFDGAEREQQGSRLVIVTCIDVLNNAWRFLSESHADLSRPNETECPPWVRHALAFRSWR